MSLSISIPGPVAQDKDWARDARARKIVPSMLSNERVCLDFSDVHIATQSFVHALLSEVTRVHGEEGLDRLEFRSCSEQVKQAIQTVITYSLRARDLAAEFVAEVSVIRSADVPQADDLRKVRRVVEALTDGPSPVDVIAEETGYSVRHTYYRASAARVLGLLHLAAGIAVITERGATLVKTSPLGLKEQQVFMEAVTSSPIMRRLVPGLLERRVLKVEEIARNLIRVAQLSPSTAHRRAGCLLSWRRQLLEKQLPLLVGGTRSLSKKE